MGNVRRIYVEKKKPYAVRAKELLDEIKNYLGIGHIRSVRVLIRYDVENISDDVFETACNTVFSEPPLDLLYREEISDLKDERMFSVEFLPGQFDQRADSAVQCIRFLKEEEDPVIKTAVTYLLDAGLSEEEFSKIKSYCINPVDSRETEFAKPETLLTQFEEPKDILIYHGFSNMEEAELKKLYDSLSLAMTYRDFLHIQSYFAKEEKRDPSVTEIRVLDTYWSDHCRHTTFSTHLTGVEFGHGYYSKPIIDSYDRYIKTRNEIFGDNSKKPVCLMDLALIAMRKLKKDNKLTDQEETDEINACSIVVPIIITEDDGSTRDEEWLISFKNETHNHPTEIEPFGGAATCLGGAIRDPLSGRSYVYQAMRVTGAADPTVPVSVTLSGKLPQKKLVRGAANGYSSYGNQIGLATGLVKEIYHPDYVAKRMEIGAVIGAAPRKNVIRETSDPGDIIILLGGRTGRDGCGGATGSSKVHTKESIETCGAEVQKGNAPTERKIQRLFRREEVSRLIKKCNDFGAGGVSVAIGELADGLIIDLDRVPKKYAGLDGTELSISESQERMAVVVDKNDVEAFLAYAKEENLEAVTVARVTEEKRLVLMWRGEKIVSLKRSFLDTNGAHQEAAVEVEIPKREENYLKRFACKKAEDAIGQKDYKAAWFSLLSDLNVCSQKGLVERFDGSIGAASVLMPYGGKYQLTETQVMAAKLPLLKGSTETATLMSYGYDPFLSSWSPYHGAVYAVVESITKIVAAGGDYKKIRFTFQEYFRRMTEDKLRWSQPFAALLGAFEAQMRFGLPSIGGKDSMSGTFQDIDVPPTLVSFAVDVVSHNDILTPELKQSGSRLVLFEMQRDEYDLPVYESAMKMYDRITALQKSGCVISAYALDAYGIAAAVSKMAFGNKLGVELDSRLTPEKLFGNGCGNILVEVPADRLEAFIAQSGDYNVVGTVLSQEVLKYQGVSLSMEEALHAWKEKLNKVFPDKVSRDTAEETYMDELLAKSKIFLTDHVYVCRNKFAQPHVFIPVFPGTNCEYDSQMAFERAGATVTARVFQNLSPEDIRESVKAYANEIKRAQIVMFPGGFSAGDEPDGSAKFFATAFQNELIKESLDDLLANRDGLVLGICNGFQAMIKLGLLPYGEVTAQTVTSPTLTYNTINRHISRMVYTKVVSNKSPWMMLAEPGNVYVNPASNGEGRFVANREWIVRLFENGQVATQYADFNANVTLDAEYNINGSFAAIEGITSLDGRCFGKMAHSERTGVAVAKNIYGEQDLKIFESGVKYFQ